MITLKLILALIAVESGGNKFAIGDDGQAIGPMQIHSLVLWDVNTYAHTHYTAGDCFDEEKSEEIFALYESLYCTADHIGRTPTDRDLAMTWHWGPYGYKHDDTDGYWAKVQAAEGKP